MDIPTPTQARKTRDTNIRKSEEYSKAKECIVGVLNRYDVKEMKKFNLDLSDVLFQVLAVDFRDKSWDLKKSGEGFSISEISNTHGQWR